MVELIESSSLDSEEKIIEAIKEAKIILFGYFERRKRRDEAGPKQIMSFNG